MEPTALQYSRCGKDHTHHPLDWPKSGDIIIEKCERQCRFPQCKAWSKTAAALRKHVVNHIKYNRLPLQVVPASNGRPRLEIRLEANSVVDSQSDGHNRDEPEKRHLEYTSSPNIQATSKPEAPPLDSLPYPSSTEITNGDFQLEHVTGNSQSSPVTSVGRDEYNKPAENSTLFPTHLLQDDVNRSSSHSAFESAQPVPSYNSGAKRTHADFLGNPSDVDYFNISWFDSTLLHRAISESGMGSSTGISNHIGSLLTCPTCGKSIQSVSELKRHALHHTKPYFCNQAGCPRTEGFSTLNDLDRHNRSRHPTAMPIPIQSTIYHCPVTGCKSRGKPWPRLDNFRSHIKRVHGVQTEEKIAELVNTSRSQSDGIYKLSGADNSDYSQNQRKTKERNTLPPIISLSPRRNSSDSGYAQFLKYEAQPSTSHEVEHNISLSQSNEPAPTPFSIQEWYRIGGPWTLAAKRTS